MNKKLAILAGVGSIALSGCSFLFGGKAKQALQELVDAGAALQTFQGHEIATSVSNGQEYYLGVYRKGEDLMRFANGDYHRDSKGFYPFYMNTVSGTLEGACTVKVKTLNFFKKTFGLLVSAPGMEWDGKYIGVYGAQSSVSNNAVTSLALLDDPEQTEYKTIANHQAASDTVFCSGVFKFYDYYDGLAACSPGCLFQNEIAGDDEATPKFFGTGHNPKVTEGEADYTSIDAKGAYDALGSVDNYDLIHLYKK